ncbi:TetR/AcrR family transcriptional regulator C-terminal domain-containing protein [Kitasatospora sp. NPDC057512]|uniref:TetR/AcrR family transcriptional regulator C-terminal domain-containing protein n=1 Tax=Kitasatospora sp. NPDC057512 TaxID=3346154 RepID=UPI0036D15F30
MARPGHWLEAGPVASRRGLAQHVEALAGRGLLAVEDAAPAAERFTLLTFHGVAERSFRGALPVADGEVERIATAGVDAFLRIHGAPSAVEASPTGRAERARAGAADRRPRPDHPRITSS